MKQGAIIGAKNAKANTAKWFGVVDESRQRALKAQYMRRKAGVQVDQTRTLAKQLGVALPNNPRLAATANQAFRKHGDALALRRAIDDSSSSDDSSDYDDAPVVRRSGVEETTTDLATGLAHYRQLQNAERTKQIKPGWLGGEVNRRRRSVDMVDAQTAMRRPKRKHSNIRDDTMVALQLQAMPTYGTTFISLISFIQFALTISVMVLAYQNNEFATFGFALKGNCTDGGDKSSCPTDFIGRPDDSTLGQFEEDNWTFGPDTEYMMSYFARVNMCMREDTNLNVQAAAARSRECHIGGTEPAHPSEPCGNAGSESAACCMIPAPLPLASAFTGGAMMTLAECNDWRAEFEATYTYGAGYTGDAVVDGAWIEGEYCGDSNNVQVILKPCCNIRTGECSLKSSSQCQWSGGIEAADPPWKTTGSPDTQVCSEVNCVSQLCELDLAGLNISYIGSKLGKANEADNPNQWFRLITSLFIFSGLISMAVLLFVQYYCGKMIEVQAGKLRTFLIYFISGIGGNLIGGIFAPDQVATGSDPAAFGLLAVTMVELFQAWQIVPDRKAQLTKLLLLTIVALMVGTLPYIDNWSHLGGFCFGAVSGVVFLPYITFGAWDARRKKILLWICGPLLLLMFITAILLFYLVQNGDFCDYCHYINCVPYSDTFTCD